MSQRDGFAGGFIAGAIVGSVVGGILGALVVYKRDSEQVAEEEPQLAPSAVDTKKITKKRPIKAPEQEAMDMEVARRSLEDKIAQLNATIDEVRQQLGSVNGTTQTMREQPSRSE